ncbi:hypothetical protein EAS68_00485 [Legionella jordanis]|uniref:hypothetical protein n=1 Tax=Legionella jordanis TaxID=456 RepID=UPI000F40C0E2|nr:hypothetical protein [Legionella jordanis]RMX22041.1 hypothetical protein EAS68_00485 [Legionella jordanis]
MHLSKSENSFEVQLIRALYKDIRTAKHGREVNSQALTAAISLLEEIEKYPHICLAELMVGTINMATSIQIMEYKNIAPDKIGETLYNRFMKERNYWFADYDKMFKAMSPLPLDDGLKVAMSVIKRAAQSPLYLSPCVPHTTTLYFEYLKAQDVHFVPPSLPDGETFAPWTKEQFSPFHTEFSVASLLNLSLFAVKKHKLPTQELPGDVQTKLQNLHAPEEYPQEGSVLSNEPLSNPIARKENSPGDEKDEVIKVEPASASRCVIL